MLYKTIFTAGLALSSVLLTSCLTHRVESREEGESDELTQAPLPREVDPTEIDETIAAEIPDSALEKPIAIGSEEDEINKAIKDGLPIEMNEKVQTWINYFSRKNGDAFQRFMDRGEPYKYMIAATLREHGIPSEIYFQAMIESGFVIHAKSTASAVGFWQFIPATGRRYGLRVDRYVDERRDPWRSTVAASMYLSDLNNVFDSWYLAMAAYNAGEMRIMNAIMRGKSRDFWTLVKNRQLPAETMDYIPKVLAAFIVGSDPEKYGLRKPEATPHESVALVSVPSPVPLQKIADLTQISLDTLKRFNPHLKAGITPPGSAHYKIWVPRAVRQAVADVSDQLGAFRLNIKTPQALATQDEPPTGKRQYHRVKRGENLAKIAQKYRMSVDELMRLNKLKSSRLFIGRKLKVRSEVGGMDSSRDAAANATPPIRKAAALASLRHEVPMQADDRAGGLYYKVKRGDNLRGIARRFRVSVKDLKRINQLSSHELQAGQMLRLHPRASARS